MIPRPRLLALLSAVAALTALGDVSPAFLAIAVALALAGVILAVIDFRATPRVRPGDITRDAPPQLSIGAPQRIGLQLVTSGPAIVARVRDEVPHSFSVEPRVVSLRVPAGGEATAEYVVRPRHRGSFRFGSLHARAIFSLKGAAPEKSVSSFERS